MNKADRARLRGILEKMETLKEEIDEIRSTEEEKLDNMPESLRDSTKGDEMQEGIDVLESAYNSMDEACDSLNEVV